MKVSAVIPHYGDFAPTLTLIEALRAQQGIAPDELEIIVSDDQSPVPFPDTTGVRVVRRETNGGFGSAVNSGVAVATGKWLFILNSDLSITDTFVADMLSHIEHRTPALASPQVVGHDGKQQWVARKFPTTAHIAWEWFTPLARFKPSGWWHRGVGHDVAACTSRNTVETDWVIGAAMVVPRDIYNRVGGMDERFYMNSEEVDFQRRLAEAGVPRLLVPQVRVEHEGGGSSPSARRRQWLTTARFTYADKWGDKATLGRTLKATSYANFLVNTVRAARNKEVNAQRTLREELAYVKRGENGEN